MKKAIIIFVISVLVASHNYINSQDVTLKETIDSINVMLKSNPYIDSFNEISFFYSVDITPENVLVVEMTFDGPFKWVYKAKISDLDTSPKKDPCRESPGTLCWTCKHEASEKAGSCVQAEMILTDGGSTKENSSSICVSFSSRGICNELNRKFQFLFSKIMNENRK